MRIFVLLSILVMLVSCDISLSSVEENTTWETSAHTTITTILTSIDTTTVTTTTDIQTTEQTTIETTTTISTTEATSSVITSGVTTTEEHTTTEEQSTTEADAYEMIFEYFKENGGGVANLDMLSSGYRITIASAGQVVYFDIYENHYIYLIYVDDSTGYDITEVKTVIIFEFNDTKSYQAEVYYEIHTLDRDYYFNDLDVTIDQEGFHNLSFDESNYDEVIETMKAKSTLYANTLMSFYRTYIYDMIGIEV